VVDVPDLVEERDAPLKPEGEIEKLLVNTVKELQIGAGLSADLKQELVQFLTKRQAVFAWSVHDLQGIDPKIITHKLSVDPDKRPVKQKRRLLTKERIDIVNAEVEKLKAADQIREVFYPDWLANTVVVPKKNGKWRVCVDYTDLNKACPKDSYPIPRIDQLVDSTAGNELMSFMDAYSGYNQISMDSSDEEKTAFITSSNLYCYKVMPFGLKNAGATYQRLVNQMFKNQIGKNMEIYIDDMLVKSRKKFQHVADLEEAFDVLEAYGLKLNPSKCVFGVAAGKFLGFLVSERGIEADPDQISSLRNMRSPQNKKEVQSLNGRAAALNRFISKASDKCLPFFKAIRGGKDFEWTPECEEAFQKLKAYLGSPELLSIPQPGEVLQLYLGVSTNAVSSALIRDDGGVQRPIYYVSKTLLDSEKRYPCLEKLIYALIVSARKLRPYFQSHSIVIPTSQPLRSVLHKPDTSGRLMRWALELGEFDVQFVPRTAIKSQALADFVAEFTGDDSPS